MGLNQVCVLNGGGGGGGVKKEWMCAGEKERKGVLFVF